MDEFYMDMDAKVTSQEFLYTIEKQDLVKMIFCDSATTFNELGKSGRHLSAESTVRRWIWMYNLRTAFQRIR